MPITIARPAWTPAMLVSAARVPCRSPLAITSVTTDPATAPARCRRRQRRDRAEGTWGDSEEDFVMAGLVPTIHVLRETNSDRKTWMPGSSSAKTRGACHRAALCADPLALLPGHDGRCATAALCFNDRRAPM